MNSIIYMRAETLHRVGELAKSGGVFVVFMVWTTPWDTAAPIRVLYPSLEDAVMNYCACLLLAPWCSKEIFLDAYVVDVAPSPRRVELLKHTCLQRLSEAQCHEALGAPVLEAMATRVWDVTPKSWAIVASLYDSDTVPRVESSYSVERTLKRVVDETISRHDLVAIRVYACFGVENTRVVATSPVRVDAIPSREVELFSWARPAKSGFSGKTTRKLSKAK